MKISQEPSTVQLLVTCYVVYPCINYKLLYQSLCHVTLYRLMYNSKAPVVHEENISPKHFQLPDICLF